MCIDVLFDCLPLCLFVCHHCHCVFGHGKAGMQKHVMDKGKRSASNTCELACWFVCLFVVCLFVIVCLFVCWFVGLFVGLLVCWFWSFFCHVFACLSSLFVNVCLSLLVSLLACLFSRANFSSYAVKPTLSKRLDPISHGRDKFGDFDPSGPRPRRPEHFSHGRQLWSTTTTTGSSKHERPSILLPDSEHGDPVETAEVKPMDLDNSIPATTSAPAPAQNFTHSPGPPNQSPFVATARMQDPSFVPVFSSTRPQRTFAKFNDEKINFPPGIRDHDHWGTAIITYGQKVKVLTYAATVCDLSYVTWIMAHTTDQCGAAQRDFRAFCICNHQLHGKAWGCLFGLGLPPLSGEDCDRVSRTLRLVPHLHDAWQRPEPKLITVPVGCVGPCVLFLFFFCCSCLFVCQHALSTTCTTWWP